MKDPGRKGKEPEKPSSGHGRGRRDATLFDYVKAAKKPRGLKKGVRPEDIVIEGIKVVGHPREQLAQLAEDLGMTPAQAFKHMKKNGTYYIDKRHGDNVNILLQHSDVYRRITLNPSEDALISCGRMQHDQVAKLIANGKLVKK